MDHVHCPTSEQWEARQNWYESHIFDYEERGSYLVGEQASALLFDVQSVFCAGAWVSVVVLAFAVIEASLMEVDSIARKRTSVQLLKDHGLDERFQKLRVLRNQFVHAKYDKPAITIDQQYDERGSMEEQARWAVELMFEAFYSNPGT